jgi:hypothetical protein
MLTRLFAIAFLYLAMFLAWAGLGSFMLLAPRRFLMFLEENVISLTAGRPGEAATLMVRVGGLGLFAFAVRFAVRFAELWSRG